MGLSVLLLCEWKYKLVLKNEMYFYLSLFMYVSAQKNVVYSTGARAGAQNLWLTFKNDRSNKAKYKH